jgi:hypothetical protein
MFQDLTVRKQLVGPIDVIVRDIFVGGCKMTRPAARAV